MKKSGFYIKTRDETGERLYENGELRHEEAKMWCSTLTKENIEAIRKIWNYYMEQLGKEPK